MSDNDELNRLIDQYGPEWAMLYVNRNFLAGILKQVEGVLIDIEKRDFLVGSETISSQANTIDINRDKWNAWDWSQLGEEWTWQVQHRRGINPDEWKKALIQQVMLKHISPGGTVLEIGPGGGRWTEHLQKIAGHLILADISVVCLDLCKKRFSDETNIQYHLIGEELLDFLEDGSISDVWSYDVFVHINPTDIDRYLRVIKRVLKVGGHAVIHHAGTYETEDIRTRNFRTHMNREFFAHLVKKHGMEMLEQSSDLVHFPGDIISVFKKTR